MESIYDFTQTELREKLVAARFTGYSAGQVFEWVYKKRARDFDSMSSLSRELKGFLKGNFSALRLSLIKEEKSSDRTEKFLFRLEDDLAIETVLIPEGARNTLCVSTQAGCKFKCRFCASGAEGFKRNLTPAEIIGQYLTVSDLEPSCKISNMVFMGIGEPLDNFKNVVKSIKILVDSKGANFSKRKITLSTCGLPLEIKRLAGLKLGIKLSVSLHSADDSIRSKLMPVNKKYPLETLIAAIKEFTKASRSPVTFEYVLIRDVNSGKSDARKLAKLLNRINAKANLIPYNGFSSDFKAPLPEQVDIFSRELKQKGAFFTLRKPRGRDINAACGQLRACSALNKGER